MEQFVAACIVTYQRPAELERLLRGLAGCKELSATVVVDNASSGETRELVEKYDATYVAAENLGPGAGWKRGMEIALDRHPQLTHFWCLDDDVVVESAVLSRLLTALESEGALAAAPLLTDGSGKVWAFPEPLRPDLRKTIRKVGSPAEAIHALGRSPIEWVWCTGACLLITREAVERAGYHRTDFWMLGEDLEYSMRLSALGRCIFLPDVFVPHLPGENPDGAASRAGNHRKFLALLQNLSFLSFHSPHRRHMGRYLPGNFRRFFRDEGWSAASVRAAWTVFWRGAVRGRPHGETRPSE